MPFFYNKEGKVVGYYEVTVENLPERWWEWRTMFDYRFPGGDGLYADGDILTMEFDDSSVKFHHYREEGK